MTSEQTNELQELSPEPLYNGRDYFDNKELKQEQKDEDEIRTIHDMRV